jgi:hypothetical protein
MVMSLKRLFVLAQGLVGEAALQVCFVISGFFTLRAFVLWLSARAGLLCKLYHLSLYLVASSPFGIEFLIARLAQLLAFH